MMDVPLFRQPKKSADCGPVTLQMLLHYYGKKKSRKQITNEIKVFDVGTYAQQLGMYLLKKGFQVTLITLNPRLFLRNDQKIKKKELLKRFENLAKNEKLKRGADFFVKYIEKGGKIVPKIPELEDIEKEIQSGRPVIALMTTNFMKGKKPDFNFHYNLVTGIDEKYVYVNDPLWDHRGGKNKYTRTEFLYGLYASAYGEADNASLILARKK